MNSAQSIIFSIEAALEYAKSIGDAELVAETRLALGIAIREAQEFGIEVSHVTEPEREVAA